MIIIPKDFTKKIFLKVLCFVSMCIYDSDKYSNKICSLINKTNNNLLFCYYNNKYLYFK